MIHGMMIVRNEASRKLETEHTIFSSVLTSLLMICDRIVVCDDSSTDDTYRFVERLLRPGDYIFSGNERLWDKDEVSLRKMLWDITIMTANHNDWIICLDADEIIQKPSNLKYMLNMLPENIDGLGFRLYDMWNMKHYREDNLWKAHHFPWCMAIRYDENREYKWHDKKLHCGRFPANGSLRMLPTHIPIKHYGWALEEDRKIKYDRYMSIDGDGKHGILAQYKSILDAEPNLIEFGG